MDTTLHRIALMARRIAARFVATCPDCGATISDNQVMCSICASK
jgi:hypothetical protein